MINKLQMKNQEMNISQAKVCWTKLHATENFIHATIGYRYRASVCCVNFGLDRLTNVHSRGTWHRGPTLSCTHVRPHELCFSPLYKSPRVFFEVR